MLQDCKNQIDINTFKEVFCFLFLQHQLYNIREKPHQVKVIQVKKPYVTNSYSNQVASSTSVIQN